MKRRASLLSGVVCVAVGLVLAGCGGGSNPTPPPVISVAISPASATVQMGGTAEFSASVTNDPSVAGVNWTVNCSSAPCGTVSPEFSMSGDTVTYTAPSDAPANDLPVALMATSVADSTKSSAANIIVPSVAISVTPATNSVLAGDVTTLTATVTHDASNQGVRWTVSCAEASCGAVAPATTASGAAATYTAPPPPAADLQVTITAISVADPPARAGAGVTVPAIVVTTQPGVITVPGNTTTQFSATVSNDLANGGVTWSVACSIPPCGKISPLSTASGAPTTYTAPAQLPDDMTVTITAASVADARQSSPAYATVPAVRVSAISPNSALLPQNTTQAFKATVEYDNSNKGVTWSLSKNGVACSPGCGTIDPATTPSGAVTTYTAPSTVAAKTQVTLNAASAANESKVASANFTLTNGTVKLVPASLSFECKGPEWGGKSCPPPSQVVTLTNSGATALTINGISITGSSQFTQTNDCGVSVNPGSSCGITVSFAATMDDVTGTMVINDGSVDSPQQVALGGTTSAMEPENAAMAQSDLASTTFAAVPPPTGTNTVGTQVLYLTDASREDPYLANGTKRELTVRLWYPASPNSASNCQPAPYASAAVWQYYAELAHVQPFAVKTNSCWNAPVANGLHPLVVFSPGYTATATDYTFLLEDLASRGYVVAAINHTYEATAVTLRDGRLARSVVGSHLGGPVLRSHWPLSSAVSVRLLDLKFVLTEIEGLNSLRDGPFAGKLDLSKIAVAGHSLGGLTAYLGIEFDPRLKAAVMLDAPVPNALGSATQKPVLLISAGRQQWRAEECRLWNNLQGPRLAVSLSGTEHVALSDWIWLSRNALKVGPMGAEKTMDAVRDYIAAFLDANVRGDQFVSPSLLSGSSPAFPGALVTGAGQPLCRQQ